MTTYSTFSNYPGGKPAAVANAIEHREQDRLITGKYYKNGTSQWKGCSVGCFAKTEERPHRVWAELFCTPEWMPRLVDHIYEWLPHDERLDWHVDVIDAMPEGVDISSVGPAHAERCLRRCVAYIGEGSEDWRARCRSAVQQGADILATGRCLTDAEAEEVARAAKAAKAVRVAKAARAAEAAEWAAWAEGEARAAEAAEWAAWAEGAARAAEAAEIRAQRDDLLELLRGLDSGESD